MHPGSLFLGFSLFEFSCSSNIQYYSCGATSSVLVVEHRRTNSLCLLFMLSPSSFKSITRLLMLIVKGIKRKSRGDMNSGMLNDVNKIVGGRLPTPVHSGECSAAHYVIPTHAVSGTLQSRMNHMLHFPKWCSRSTASLGKFAEHENCVLNSQPYRTFRTI
jgi:hypothetical protein